MQTCHVRDYKLPVGATHFVGCNTESALFMWNNWNDVVRVLQVQEDFSQEVHYIAIFGSHTMVKLAEVKVLDNSVITDDF